MIYINSISTPNALAIHIAELRPKLENIIKKKSLPTYIKNYLLANLTDILGGEPNKLLQIHNEFENLTKKRKKQNTRKDIENIFRYDLFINKKQSYNAYDLAENLGFNVCPYCNREHTLTINSKKVSGQLTRPTLDHFLPKSKYPLFALSFYNLIPSCTICNSTFKGDKPVDITSHLHPYVDNFLNHIEFDYKDVIVNGKADIVIFIKPIKDCPDKNRISETLRLFEIEKLYNGHKYIVKDILAKKKELNSDYLEILAKHTYTGLRVTKEYLYYMAFGTYLEEENFYQRPFSKIIFDILNKEKMLEHLSKI